MYLYKIFVFLTVLQLDISVALVQEQIIEEYHWEYEPRVWLSEEVNSGKVALENDFPETENMGSLTGPSFVETFSPGAMKQDNIRKRSYFLDHHVDLRQQQEQEGECNQFRVDTREAVICDKQRCDKLEFEWPTYENQIALIETTKHGMRFHRADFAMSNNSPTSYRIKFDIMELFKPKPTEQPPTTTTSTTVPPTSTTTTSTPNSADETSTLQPKPDRDANIDSHDSNNTQLITTFRLDTRRRKQAMVGFGGALSDSTCRNIKSLSPQMSKSLMEDYFGDKGLKYNIARMSIGSSDFSTSPYTNNDRPERLKFALDEKDDVEMKNFRLTDEDYEYKLPVARQAIATSKQELKFFASLWSPPIWMKNNSDIVHGFLKGDVYGPYYKALAELMLKWLEAYRKNGIEFWGLTGLNEPITGTMPFIFHNSLGITRDDYITFFKIYLGPIMRQRGFQNTKLIILDDNKGHAAFWVKAFLEDKEASEYVSGVGFHWYTNDEYENLNFIAKNHPDKFILSTEACNGFMPFQVHAMPGDWDRGVAYMMDILRMIQKNSVGWVDWNMALDLTGGPSWINNNLDAAIIVNTKRDEYYKSPMFYAVGHFSRFVEPGSVRLDYRIANARYEFPIEAVGFHTPSGYIVIVVLNANKHQVLFKMIVDRQLIRVLNLRADSFNTLVFKWTNSTSKMSS